MKKINLWKEDRKKISIKGNRVLGENVIIISPDDIVSKEHGNENLKKQENWERTIELSVFLSTWLEIHRKGTHFEKLEKKYYTHESELEGGYRGKRLSFLKNENLLYKDRFLLVSDDKTDYIYDNKFKKYYQIERIETFKNFKEKLKELGLI